MAGSTKRDGRAAAPGGASGGSLQQTVTEALRQRLVSGALMRGSKLPTLRQVADEFAVSTMTVRQAYRTLEKEGHIRRIPHVGAFVDSVRTPRAKGRAVHNFAFAATDLANAFEMGIARGVERCCRERGWTLQTLDGHHDLDFEEHNIRRLPELGIDGAIVIPSWGDFNRPQPLFDLLNARLPFVVADRIPAGLVADLIESDHEKGAFMATRHLLERGHKRVFLLTPPPLVSSIAARLQGYRRALRSFGMTPSDQMIAWLDLHLQDDAFLAQEQWRGGFDAILPLLKTHEPPLGVFAVDPYTAWGVYEACRELNLRIPEDVSVVCFDESEISIAMRPRITIVRQRTAEIGYAAVEVLTRLCEQPERAAGRRNLAHVVVDVDLVEGESVAKVSPR